MVSKFASTGQALVPSCPMKEQCTTGDYRRIRRWEHEDVLEQVQQRLDRKPVAMTLRRCTVGHVFGTLKHWMGWTHFLTKKLEHVNTEMSLHVLAYNLKRVIAIIDHLTAADPTLRSRG